MKKALAFLAVLLLALTGFGGTKTFTIGSVTPSCGAATTPALSVDDASGLTDVSFTLAYDAAMLTHTGCTILAPGWAVGTCSAAGGVVTVAISGPALGAGAMGLVSINFNVLGTVCDGDSTALNLEAVLYNTTNSGTAVDGLCTITCPANVPPGTASAPNPADGEPCGPAGMGVVFSWAAASGATSYNVYIDGFFDGSTPALTWTYVGSITGGSNRTWRIDPVNACGTTTGATWTYTADPLPPSPFTNVAPADGTSGVAMTNVILDWNDSTGATSYDVYFGTDNPPATMVANVATSTHTVAGPLAASTTYFWYVVAQGACAHSTAGAQWSFTTTAGGPCVHQAFAFDLITSNMVRFNLATPGTQTVVGSIGADDPFGGDFIAGDYTRVYALLATANQLVYYDTTTAAKTVVGASAPLAGHAWIGMAAAPSGTVYVASTDCATTSNLYTINATTGAVTSVGAITNANCLINLAADSTGQLYGLDIAADNLLAINSVTGAGTVIGAVGFNANYAQGMDYDADTCTMYMAAYNDTSGQGELRTVNLTTGATTLVGAFIGGDELDAPAIVSCTGPGAPAAFNLLTPANAAIDQAVNGLVLDWADAASAMTYDLYFGTANPPPLFQSNLTASTYTVSGLATGTTYYWYVVAKNNCGTTGSATWSFTTVLVANPALSYLSSTFTDACPTGGAGNGNGIIDPGEDITLTVTAQNTGTGNASGISATLSTTSAGVAITTASAAYPNILSGGTGASTTPYAFHVDFATACGTTLNFTLDFVSAEGTWSSSFTLAVGSTVVPLLIQNFDAVVPPALPAGWATVVVSGTSASLPWITNVGRTYPAGAAHSAPNTARFRSYSITTGSSRLYTTSGLDLSGASASQLTFWMYHDTGYTYADTIQPQVSTDGGTVWINVGAAVPRYDGTVQWTQHTVDLSAYAGLADVRVGFLGTSDFGNDCYVDTVRVTGTMAAPACTACTAGSPTLAYQGRSFTDLCASGGVGNGDGIADPGESLSVTVLLTNSGTAMATGVSAVLSTSTAGVTVTTPNASYPDILAGGTQASTTPYAVYIAETVPCLTLIDFSLAITSAEGTWTGTFQIQVGAVGGPVTVLTQNFNAMPTGAPSGGWTTQVITGNAWTIYAGYTCSAPNVLSYPYSATQAADSWAYSPGVALQAGTTYTLSFNQRVASAVWPENLSVWAGTTANNASQTIPIYSANGLANTTCTARGGAFTVPANGTYYIGFHCTSAADMFRLIVDDVVLTYDLTGGCNICVCPLPGAFNLLAPANAATGLPITNVVLDWEDSAGATSYDVSFGTVNPPPPIATAATSTYTVAGPLAGNTTYYWSVTARNACGILTTTVWSFTTCAAPGAFALLTPLNAATGQATANLLLDWADSAGATSYDLYFGTTNPPATYAPGLVASQYTVAGPLLDNTTYYWYVTAIGGCGTLSTAVWSFTTGTATPPCSPPTAVTLLAPPNGAADVPVPVTLEWQADPNATSYEIGLGLTPTNLTQVAIVTGTSYTLTGLAEGTTYYWRVSALNECGFANSPVWSFTTAGQVGPTGSTIFIPAVASATGDRSSQWKTDLQIMNRSTDDKSATYSITFIPADTDGTLSTHIITGSLGPGQMKKYEDIVETAFGLTETSGGLRIVADQPVIAICRTYNDTGEGTYGQLVKGYGPDAVLGLPDLRGVFRQGETGHLIHLISGMTFRSNVGFMEVTGKAATVQIALFDDLNAPLGTKTYPLLPMGFHQVSDIFTDMGITGNHAAARAEVTVSGAGSVLAYASIIDNTTNDAIFTVAQKLLGVSSEAIRTLPATASTRGAMDTLWRTDVRVLNPTANPLDVTYTYRPVTGAVQTRTLSVPAMNILFAANVLNQIFAITDNTHGSMEVKAASPLVVSSRIYTGVEGTYGQSVPAHRSDEGIVEENFGLLLGLRTDEGYRTNLGFTEIAGGSITLLVQLHDLTGAYLGQTWLTLAPYEHYSINDVFTYLGLYGPFEAYAVVNGQDGPGRAAAYASVVDNRTGDAIYVPAQ